MKRFTFLSRFKLRRPAAKRSRGWLVVRAGWVALMPPLCGGCHLMGPAADAANQGVRETLPAPTIQADARPAAAIRQPAAAIQQPTARFEAGSSYFATERDADFPPPRIEDYAQLPRVEMSLDDAVRLALQNNSVIGDLGGQVLSMPDTLPSTFDASLIGSHPSIGPQAALAAFDTQFESGVTYNGGGRGVGSAFSSGQFGVFAQPQTLTKLGFAKVLPSGTAVSVGGVAGYDEELAGGAYAALGGELRHPLMRGAGRQIQQITGPFQRPGFYGGILIARSKQQQASLALEQAVNKLVMDVAAAYWELHFAYQNTHTKQVALEYAAQTWQREQQRVAAATSPADRAAQAHHRYCVAKAEVSNAIAGTGSIGSGVYSMELRLRTLLGLPSVDGRLIVPDAAPMSAEIRFDWQESVAMAHANRVELRRQEEILRVAKMESIAAHNLQLPQVDLLGAYRKLGDDPIQDSPIFNQPLDGWQVGIEIRRAVSNRLENAAVRHARLRLSRELAVLQSQRQFINAELQAALTQLDRAYQVVQVMTDAEQAAAIRLAAEAERHEAGDHLIEQVLDAQLRLTESSTMRQRAIVDYNLAFVSFHHARGTLLDTIGVVIADSTRDETRFAQLSPSSYLQAK
ncbi:TolC family protein [Planctomycetaceae bacterium SH139]